MSLTAEGRRDRIVRLIGESGRMPVRRLADMLQVSAMTIRRDLEALENEEAVRRVHGSAILQQEVGYELKRVSHADEKRLIAAVCADMIKQGDTVFLDAGTTTFEVARSILDIPELFVITNDIKIAFLLSQVSAIEVMCCEGMIQRETGSVFGLFANQMMGYVQIDKAFMGAASINKQFNVLTPTLDKVSLKRTAIANSQESYLVVDGSKFNKKALMKVNNLSDYTGVITTRAFTPEELRRIDRSGIRIIHLQAQSRSARDPISTCD